MTKPNPITRRYHYELVPASGIAYTIEASRRLTDVELTHLWNTIYDTPLPDHPASPWWIDIGFTDDRFEGATLRLHGVTPQQAQAFALLIKPDWATWLHIGDYGGTVVTVALDHRPRPDRLSRELGAGAGV